MPVYLCKEQEAGIAEPPVVLVEHQVEIGGLLQTMAGRKSSVWSGNGHVSDPYRPGLKVFPSDGQYFTALGAPTLEYQSAALGRHPGPEAVSSLALDDTRLKCSFHDELPGNG